MEDFFAFVVIVQSLNRVWLFVDPMNNSTPGSSILHHLLEFAQMHVIESVMVSNHLILYCPLLLSSMFPSIRVFSKEQALCIRWTKSWSFSFSNSPSNKYLGLISFRIDLFDFLDVQGDSQESSPAPQFESINSSALSLIYGPIFPSVHDYWENHIFEYTDHCSKRCLCFLILCLGFS